MTEWGVFGVIVAIISFGVLVGTPLLRLNSTITRLETVLDAFEARFKKEREDIEKVHHAIWDKCTEHEVKINDHETRITVLESKGA